MEINYFKEFVVLAQTGNFMEAADILYSSQSTLSKHIKSMESKLGVPLFDRTTRKVHISKFGMMLLPYARHITELQNKYLAVLHSSLETNKDIFNLGSIYGLAQYKITDALVNFKRTRPQSTLNVIQTSSRELKDLLRQRKVELAFIRDIEDEEDEFVNIPYATDTVVAVLPVTHSLAKQKIIPLKILAEEDFLLEVPGTKPYLLSKKACELSGFEPKITCTDSEIENLVDLAGDGMGIALGMKQMVLMHHNPKVAVLDITPNVQTRVELCYLRGVELSEAAKHFLICAETHKAENGFLNEKG